MVKVKKSLNKEIQIDSGVEVKFEKDTFTVKGPKGENTKKINMKGINVEITNEAVKLIPKVTKQKFKKEVNAVTAHLKNMIKGVQKEFEYKLEAVFKHFPMNIEIKGERVIVKNFLGEKVPRECEVVPGVKVNLDKTSFTLTGTDKEKVGTMATRLEQMCRITNRDRRIFQDGIFLTSKNGKEI